MIQLPDKITDERYTSIQIAIMRKGAREASIQKDTENCSRRKQRCFWKYGLYSEEYDKSVVCGSFWERFF